MVLGTLCGTAQAAAFLNSAPVYIGGSASRIRSPYCTVKNTDTVSRLVQVSIVDGDSGSAWNTGPVVTLYPGQSTRLRVVPSRRASETVHGALVTDARGP